MKKTDEIKKSLLKNDNWKIVSDWMFADHFKVSVASVRKIRQRLGLAKDIESRSKVIHRKKRVTKTYFDTPLTDENDIVQ